LSNGALADYKRADALAAENKDLRRVIKHLIAEAARLRAAKR
jgi:hypothetical protein